MKVTTLRRINSDPKSVIEIHQNQIYQSVYVVHPTIPPESLTRLKNIYSLNEAYAFINEKWLLKTSLPNLELTPLLITKKEGYLKCVSVKGSIVKTPPLPTQLSEPINQIIFMNNRVNYTNMTGGILMELIYTG